MQRRPRERGPRTKTNESTWMNGKVYIMTTWGRGVNELEKFIVG